MSVPFTLGGTAVAGTDYSGVTASPLVIPAGQTSGTITGTLFSDPGASQTLTFTLGTPPGGATLGSPSVNTLTITEPNPAPTLTSVSPSSATVGAAATTVTVTAHEIHPGLHGGLQRHAADHHLRQRDPGDGDHPGRRPDHGEYRPDHGGHPPAPEAAPSAAPNLLPVNNPAPTLTGISPTTVTVGSPNTTITVTRAAASSAARRWTSTRTAAATYSFVASRPN